VPYIEEHLISSSARNKYFWYTRV